MSKKSNIILSICLLILIILLIFLIITYKNYSQIAQSKNLKDYLGYLKGNYSQNDNNYKTVINLNKNISDNSWSGSIYTFDNNDLLIEEHQIIHSNDQNNLEETFNNFQTNINNGSSPFFTNLELSNNILQVDINSPKALKKYNDLFPNDDTIITDEKIFIVLK